MVLVNEVHTLHLLCRELLHNFRELAVDFHIGNRIQSTRSLFVGLLQELGGQQ
jgi:hypothetical protein